MDSSEKVKKRLENITGLPVTSDRKEGRKRVFTSTVDVNSKGVSGQKEISFGIDEKRKRKEELKGKKIERKDDREWKTYSHSEKWTDPEGNIDVEVKTTATGDFDFNQVDNNGSAEISELTEEEARKLEEQGVKVEKSHKKDNVEASSETQSKENKGKINKTPFIWSLIVISVVSLVGVVSVFSTRV